MDFPEGDSTLFDFPETRAGGSGLPEPPNTNPPLASIQSPCPNLNFEGNMATNQPWLTINALAILGPQIPLPMHPKKIMPKFDLDKDISPEEHIKKFIISLYLVNVQHEDAICRLFCFNF